MRSVRRWRAVRGLVVGIGLTLCVAVGAPAAAIAATLTVTTTKDEYAPGDGLCALREAINAVNAPGTQTDCGTASSGANTIVLGANTYPLTLAYPHLTIGPPPTGCIRGVPHSDNNQYGDLTVFSNVHQLTIEGAGPDQTVIDACKLGDRALNIGAGASVSVRDLTITNALPPNGQSGTSGTTNGQSGTGGNPGANGGGILNAGSLTLADVTVTGNTAGDGGRGGDGESQVGGAAAGGSGGSGGAGGEGGGIYNTSSGTLAVSDSTISDNSAGNAGDGGTPMQSSGTGGGGKGGGGGLGGSGGGIDSLGKLMITGTTIDGNHAGIGGDGITGAADEMSASNAGGNGGDGGGAGDGGGVAAGGGSISVTNSTITANTAGDGGHSGAGGAGPGGGIVFGGAGGKGGAGGDGGGFSLAGLSASSFENVTVADNASGAGQAGGSGGSPSGAAGTAGAKGAGGGLFVLAVGTPPTLTNTLLDANGSGRNCATNTTTGNVIVDGGHNLSYSPPSITGLNGPIPCRDTTMFLTGDPKLGPLQDNAGPTETMALGPGSAAIDQVPSTGAGCPTTDQRGLRRPSGIACDIGAYEVTPPAVRTTPPTGVGATVATVNGNVTANLVQATVHFEYGQTSNYGSDTTAQTVTGTKQSSVSAQLSGLKPHTTYHYRIVASSSDGTSSSADATFTTTVIPPSLGGLTLSGTTISYTDSLAGRTTFVVFRLKPGVKHNGRCIKPRKHLTGKKCTRLVKVGSFTHNDQVGTNSVQFPSRIGGHRLSRGRYVLEVTSRLNGATGQTIRRSFRVT